MLPNSAFGAGTGPIFLDNLRCSGLERRLVECSHAGFEVNNCNHDQDAGIVCEPGITNTIEPAMWAVYLHESESSNFYPKEAKMFFIAEVSAT